MAVKRLEIYVVVLFVASISSTLSVRIVGLIDPVALSNAVKMIWNLAHRWLSARQQMVD